MKLDICEYVNTFTSLIIKNNNKITIDNFIKTREEVNVDLFMRPSLSVKICQGFNGRSHRFFCVCLRQ